MTLYTHPGKNLNISEGGGDDPMGSSSSPSDQNNNEKKGAVVVVDFFAHDKTKQLPSSSSSAPLLFDDPPPHLNVNLGLNLIATLGCGGDGATVNAEHLLSDNGKHKQATTVDDGQEVVKRMKVEKQELQAKLREWKSKYENLEMQCEAYAWQQRQKQHAPLQLKGAEMVVTKSFAPNNLATTDDQPTATTTNTSPPCRVAVRTLPEGPAMVDGFYWRKYGQKMEKGKPHPRAYYKCTMQAGCPVRKQVQRSWEVDKEILITTYEGEHNHAVAGEAMAMVSTTTSAVRMFMTGAMSSSDGKVMMMNPNWLAGPINPTSNLVPIKLSAMKPFPTVSLDLTGTANSYPYPYHLHNKSQFSGLHLSPHHHHAAGSSSQPPPAQQQLSFHDVTAAAAAIINSDPNFSAMIAAAVSSITSAAQPNNNNNNSSQQ